jgi:hypothetical protein
VEHPWAKEHTINLKVRETLPSGMHQTYIHLPRDNKVTNLSDIYHNGLQDDKRLVRINESPPARMSQNSAIAQEEDLRPGRRPTTAQH